MQPELSQPEATTTIAGPQLGTEQPPASLRGDGGAAAAEDVFLDLAGGGLGEFGEEGQPLRHLEAGEMFAGKLSQVRRRIEISIAVAEYMAWSPATRGPPR